MKNYIFFIIILVWALFEVTVLDSFKVFGVKPNLLLINVVIMGLVFPLKWAFILSVFAGILKDSLSATAFGLNLLLFPLWSFLIIKLSRKISLDSNFLRVTLVFIIVVANNIMVRPIYLLLGQFIPLGIFLRTTILEAVYTAVMLPLMFKFLTRTKSLSLTN